MRKFLLILIMLPFIYIDCGMLMRTDIHELPALQSGDLIFQTTLHRQSLTIMVATGSVYTQVGIVDKRPDGDFVIEAAEPVHEIPLARFIQNGWGQKITIERYSQLTDVQRYEIVQRARSLIGRHYNYAFYMRSDSIYCSELPYLVFKTENALIGKPQKISGLNVDNVIVRRFFKATWSLHPACQEPGTSYTDCWKMVLNEPVITPISLSKDPHLQEIYTNYLF